MIWKYFKRKRRDDDFALEAEAHIAHEIDGNIAAGMTPDEARAAALRRFGNVTTAKERIHEMNTIGFGIRRQRSTTCIPPPAYQSRIHAYRTAFTRARDRREHRNFSAARRRQPSKPAGKSSGRISVRDNRQSREGPQRQLRKSLVHADLSAMGGHSAASACIRKHDRVGIHTV